ncbi:MAG TPA: NAD-dependent succinate-semialdehyde dehydrogenase [Pseudonocardiaceae bacterium]|nr:NAD-dependent succinate-semialdehyde dehydrogenase [Pseudonocardiaceae bacterium]
MITTVNPATGDVLAKYPTATWAEVEQVLDATATARTGWSAAAPADRATVLGRAATTLRERRETLAELITAEMGKPLTEARAEVEKCALTFDYYAGNGPALLADEPVATQAHGSWVSYEPIGTVLAVMPWNFPLFQVIRFAAPTLAAGNAAILKHAPNTSGCALALADVLTAAGLPAGVFEVLLLAPDDVAPFVQRLIADDRVDAVTVTGSERAGAAIGSAAGQAVKKSVLELGGSDPFVVLADADPARTVEQAVRARFANGGQTCIAAKRFIVAQPIFDDFVERLTEAVGTLAVGDPTDPATRIGPMARADLVESVQRQVDESVAAGATVLTGGHRLPGPGFFYAPTVLTEVTPTMPVWAEETFGPVAVVTPAEDDEHAVRLANDTPWGLGASVWTRDLARGRAVAGRIRSGSVFVNAVVASDPRLPFGGTRRSGYGRELALAGIREFTNTRSWWVEQPA